MKHETMKKVLPIVCCFFFAFSSFAQPPQAINYQGVARDSVGHPLVNQSISIRLSILDSSSTGPVVYVETHNRTTNPSGLFNLPIGGGTVVSGNFSEISWGQNNKWIKIEMDAIGGTNYQLIGSQQFMSVPYALYSKNGFAGSAIAGDMNYYDGASWIRVPGGSYGQVLTFCNGVPKWGGCLPLITTTSVSNITSTTAIGGGNISNDGGESITARGVCWSTSNNPTIALSTKTSDGIGKGGFTSSMVALTPNTTYYVRAYATNVVGTAYGAELIFTTDSLLTGVNICSQLWMSKNLDVSIYRNGDPIPRVDNSTTWAGLTTGAYCYYNNDSATYAAVYGKLYNWYAVNDPRGLVPVGWHVPTDAEWTTLETCLGGSSVAGGAMKETGTAHWVSPNTGATNSSGFLGLPGGWRGSNGTFYEIGRNGYWWSSTEYDTMYAKVVNLFYNGSSFGMVVFTKGYGFSVRCLRD